MKHTVKIEYVVGDLEDILDKPLILVSRQSKQENKCLEVKVRITATKAEYNYPIQYHVLNKGILIDVFDDLQDAVKLYNSI